MIAGRTSSSAARPASSNCSRAWTWSRAGRLAERRERVRQGAPVGAGRGGGHGRGQAGYRSGVLLRLPCGRGGGGPRLGKLGEAHPLGLGGPVPGALGRLAAVAAAVPAGTAGVLPGQRAHAARPGAPCGVVMHRDLPSVTAPGAPGPRAGAVTEQ